MGEAPKITSSEIAAITVTWAAGLVGCRNNLQALFPQNFTLFSDEYAIHIIGSHPWNACLVILFAATLSVIYTSSYKIDCASIFKPKSELHYFILSFIVLIISCIIIFSFYFEEITFTLFTTFLAIGLIIWTHFTNKLSFTAKFALIPAISFALSPYPLQLLQNVDLPQKTYWITTTFNPNRPEEIFSAKKKGDFAEIKTKEGTFLLNINAIIKIQSTLPQNSSILQANQ